MVHHGRMHASAYGDDEQCMMNDYTVSVNDARWTNTDTVPQFRSTMLRLCIPARTRGTLGSDSVFNSARNLAPPDAVLPTSTRGYPCPHLPIPPSTPSHTTNSMTTLHIPSHSGWRLVPLGIHSIAYSIAYRKHARSVTPGIPTSTLRTN